MSDISRYLNLITSEHRTKPKFTAMLTSMLEPIDLTVDIDNAFDLDNAVGVQLDVLGLLIGVNRKLNFQPSAMSSMLKDDDYRSLLKARIIINHWDGSIGSLSDAINSWNPYVDVILTDNQDMSMDILIMGASQLQHELITHGYIIPKPAGVRYNYLASSDVVFAYDADTDTLAGYDTGTWS